MDSYHNICLKARNFFWIKFFKKSHHNCVKSKNVLLVFLLFILEEETTKKNVKLINEKEEVTISEEIRKKYSLSAPPMNQKTKLQVLIALESQLRCVNQTIGGAA